MKAIFIVLCLALAACANPPNGLDAINRDVNGSMTYVFAKGWYPPGPDRMANCATFVLAKIKALEAAGYDESRLAVLVYPVSPDLLHAVLLVDGKWVLNNSRERIYFYAVGMPGGKIISVQKAREYSKLYRPLGS
jgi:hypothetical protein